MAVQNHIYIYIGKNGAPTILNVDNAADGAVLEQLGALKMPEAMASEVFGDNAQYADNTNCTITDNPDNAEFPYNVTFDSSKIMATPKRELGTMAGIGMPSTKFIDLNIPINNDDNMYPDFIAPADGYLSASTSGHYGTFVGLGPYDASITNPQEYFHYNNLYWCVSDGAPGYTSSNCLCPIRKGQKAFIHLQGEVVNYCKFIYTQGEI